MMQKEFDELMIGVQCLDDGIQHLTLVLHELLSRPDKTFSISFKGHLYEFFPATTHEEEQRMYKLRRRFIKSLLRRVVSFNITHDNYGWDDILAFAVGPDPKDLQYEKIDLSELYEISDENGEKITSLPLNIDSTYIKMQDSRNDKQDQELAEK